uniref:Thyrotropin subunit beta n=1 Tax=Erpetoichthys calabaricus TaxID=27687 RepID=A0A8C4S2X4_ERPCA
MEMLHNILKNFLYYNPLQETPCVPTQYTLYVENPECAFCVAVNTTICAGYCMTRYVQTWLLPRMALSQTVCTYQDLAYRTIRLPGCAPQVNPFYTYPVALTCKCGKCRGGSSLSRDAQTSLSPSLQRVLGLPRGLLPVGRARNTSPGRRPGGILIRCPSHLI